MNTKYLFLVSLACSAVLSMALSVNAHAVTGADVTDAQKSGTDYVQQQLGIGDAKPIEFIPQVSIPFTDIQAGKPIAMSGTTLNFFIIGLYRFLVFFSGFLAVFMITYAGFKWMIARGDKGEIGDAKKSMINAVIGLILALLSFSILNLVNPDLITLPDLNVTSVNGITQVIDGPPEKVGTAYAYDGPPSANMSVVNASDIDAAFRAAGAAYGVSCEELKAISYIESGWGKNVVSPAGALGWMQIMPATAKASCGLSEADLRGTDPVSIKKQIDCGAKYFAAIKNSEPKVVQGAEAYCKKYNSTLGIRTMNSLNDTERGEYAAAGYNGGPGSNCYSTNKSCNGKTYWQCEANAGYNETRNYVVKFRTTYNKIKDDPRKYGCRQ